MTTEEFSNEFDTLLDSYKISNDYGQDENFFALKLDEYEKSVYLTKAQEEVVIELYTGRNNTREGYEETEELRNYLDSLNRIVVFGENDFTPIGDTSIGDRAKSVFTPLDLLFITQEQAYIKSESCGDKWIEVVPIKRDQYNRRKNNPFRNNIVWRSENVSTIHNQRELQLISKHDISKYKLSYLAKPSPILLVNLFSQDGLSINGTQNKQTCLLHEVLHRRILERAVQTAYSYMSTQFSSKEKE